jgi:RNA polymerase sigma-70 factor, ECF subfamily
MPASDSFDDCLTRLRAGDEQAAAQVFERFAERLIGLARSRLDRSLRPKVDPEDVLQSAFKSFFGRVDQSFELDSWGSLWGLLARITLYKCGHRIRYFRTAQRNVQREVGGGHADEETTREWEGLAREPTPPEAAVLAETVESMLRVLDERDRQVFVLGLQGYTAPEISAELKCSERTVFRALKYIRAELQSLQDEQPPADH